MKNDMDIRELYRPNIRSLAPYSTARDEYRGELGIFLDANENPYDNGCNRYPDPRQRELKRRLSEIKGVAPEIITATLRYTIWPSSGRTWRGTSRWWAVLPMPMEMHKSLPIPKHS